MTHSTSLRVIKNAALGICVEIFYALFIMGCAFFVGVCAIWWIK